MEKMTQKELKRLVKVGAAKDVTNSSSRRDIPEGYSQVGYSSGIYGCNGMLLRGDSGKLYAICAQELQLSTFFSLKSPHSLGEYDY